MSTEIPGRAYWLNDFRAWLEPFLEAFRRSEQRFWAPLYLQRLLGPGHRKRVEPMAEGVCSGRHSACTTLSRHRPGPMSCWSRYCVRRPMLWCAATMQRSSSMTWRCRSRASIWWESSASTAGVLGKQANCQVLVSPTLARREVPVPIALRLYLPEDWAKDEESGAQAKVPASVGFERKGNIALGLIDVAIADGVRFGSVLIDAGFGTSATFQAALSERGLLWAVSVLPAHLVYPADVELIETIKPALRRPAKHPKPSVKSVQAQQMIESPGAPSLRRYAWHNGTKGMLTARFAAVRVRVDGPLMKRGIHLPGQAAWLVCEQGHQQMKDDLGLNHYEGRSWLELHHHAPLTMMALAYLQHRRLYCTNWSGKNPAPTAPGPPP